MSHIGKIEIVKIEKCCHCHEKSAGYEDTYCQSCLEKLQEEMKKDYEKYYGKLIRKANKEARMKAKGVWKNNPDYQIQYYTKGNTMIVGIRNKPVMYSQLTPEEKKIYRDREMQKRKKNGKTSIWDYLDLR